MGLTVASQMDPIEQVSITADSTFRIGIEAQERGHSLFQYTPDRLVFDQGRVMATGRDVTLQREAGRHVEFGPWRRGPWITGCGGLCDYPNFSMRGCRAPT